MVIFISIKLPPSCISLIRWEGNTNFLATGLITVFVQTPHILSLGKKGSNKITKIQKPLI